MYRIIETKERITADNDLEASRVRKYLKDRNVYMINLMGSPGSGKTSTLLRVIAALKDKYNIGVMEADVDGAVDADTIHKAGVRVIQLHSGGLCHMDADMTFRGIESFDVEGIDLLVLENIGNLVCPAEFDVGSARRVMILSVPEGDDKPLKYPLMFTVSDVMLINKIDTKAVFDFDEEACRERALKLNPNMKIFALSAETGQGFDQFIEWLDQDIQNWRADK
ncbi:MAG: hydrogenase nickel incorporation protein HypB [Erysipelotrichaceae bacterium]|nr:hydrogenase nickel incorporation protein HypB [Erysipelotrichaceae bacterium]MBQ1303271.1 hydrogenase nickel incorporation protein HypB [Erysipelotrichaceae bacterium]